MRLRCLALVLLLLAGCAGPLEPVGVASPQRVREHVERAEALVNEVVRGGSADLLESASRELEGVPAVAETRAVRGQIHYLQGRKAEAERELAGARGLPADRQADVLMALGWIAWQRGDLAEARSRHEAAMAAAGASWNPRWELACYYVTVLDGGSCSVAAAPVPSGGGDDPEFRETRETLVAVDRLRRAGKPLEAYAVLEEQLDLEGGIEATRDEPDSRRRRTFFAQLQEEQDGVMYRLLVGDLLREGGRRDEAQRWYREVGARFPAHPALAARLR